MSFNPKRSLKLIHFLWQQLSKFIGIVFGLVNRLYESLLSSLKKAKRGDQVLAVILLLIWLGIILGAFIFKGSYVFEGNLIVENMSFTYTGGIDKLFLNNIEEIQVIDLQGSQAEPLILTGKFSDESDPQLNQKLSKYTQLTIRLPFADSRLIFSSSQSSSESEITLSELRIFSNTQVNQLSYNSEQNQLSFCLQSANHPPESCLFLENFEPPNTEKIANLVLDLGQQPLNLTLKLADFSELRIKSDRNSPEEFTLQFIPDSNSRYLKLLSPAKFTINFPALTTTSNASEATYLDWIRGDIDVKNVKFTKFDETEDVRDKPLISSILQGEIQMDKENLELKKHQFLIINSDHLGIRKLRLIQIHFDKPQGLQTYISGESRGIAVGLYPEFPVRSIEPSLLSKYLSQEAISAIIGFITAFTGILVPRLFGKS